MTATAGLQWNVDFSHPIFERRRSGNFERIPSVGTRTLATSSGERTQSVYARIAGFMFLFVTVVHLAGIAITDSMIVLGNFAATAQHIIASEQLYRIGLSLQLIPSCAAILLGAALYALLCPVAPHLALFALLWRVASSVLGAVSVLFGFVAVRLYTGAGVGLSITERQALAALLSRGTAVGIDISAIFFSVSSLIFFVLLLRSRFIPRALSLLGILGSVLFPLVGLGILVVPEQAAILQFGWAPMLAAESFTGLWLLFGGASFAYWRSKTNGPTLDAKRALAQEQR